MLPALALLSGAALIGLLVFGMWNAFEVAAGQAALDARRRAEFVSAELRALLKNPRLLEEFPETSRFDVRDGALVVPESVGWLLAPEPPTFDELDIIVQDKLQQISSGVLPVLDQRQLLRTLVDQTGIPKAHKQWLMAHAAWHAHRGGDVATRRSWLAELDAVEGGAVPVATILLHVDASGRLPGWAEHRVPVLPEPMARPLFRRLQEQGLRTADLAANHRRTVDHRRVLAAVQTELPSILPRREPSARAIGEDELLLSFPMTTGETHRIAGALIGRAALVEVISSLESASWTSLPPGVVELLGSSADEESVAVVPEFLSVRTAAVDGGRADSLFGSLSGSIFRRGPWTLGLLFMALGLISGGGLWVFYRSTRREAAAARVRSEFLTMVTHELKTPLAGIRLLAEMLREGEVRDRKQIQEYYGRLNNEAVRLSMLIENVLDLGRMERRERSYDRSALDVDALVSEAVDLFRPLAQSIGLEVTCASRNPPSDPHHEIYGDRDALLQALLNVMDNARKYAAAGGRLDVTIDTSNGSCEGGRVVLLRDHGPGIPAAERTTVFERFRRGGEHAHGSIPGVGLGLYLARTILRDHGGDLEAIAPADGGPGICFRFRLPWSTGQESPTR